MPGMSGAWTITELAELAGAALAGDPVRVNGRVRELPNERLIRWYTTIGLLDPPLARRGRTALYGPRHLLQLVAVKRRQAAGLAIAEIQAELTGATDDMLRDIARVAETIPPGAPSDVHEVDAEVDAEAATSVRRPRPRDRFWTEAPAADRPARPRAQPRRAATTVVHGIRLTAGVTLLLDDGAWPIAADDLVAIEAAARPLIDELRRRGLSQEQAELAAQSGPEPSSSGPEPSPECSPESSPESTEPVPPTSPGRRST